MNKDSKQNSKNAESRILSLARGVNWGYVAGGGLMALGLVILSVAFGQVLYTTTRGFQKITLPGAQNIELRQPGLYMGVYPQDQGGDSLSPERAARLQISLMDLNSGYDVPLQRIPGVPLLQMGRQRGILLFQFETAEPGRFLLRSDDPEGQGPRLDALLVHESLAHNRADLTVGVILCLVLGGFGLYILMNTRRQARAAALPAPSPSPKNKKR